MNDEPHPMDVHVGRRLRERRKALGISQEKLGEALGLTFQQVQKYERGTNRVSASKLYEAARVLDVPVSWFFDGIDGAAETPPTNDARSPETAELVEAFRRLPNARLRRHVLDLVRGMAQGADD